MAALPAASLSASAQAAELRGLIEAAAGAPEAGVVQAKDIHQTMSSASVRRLAQQGVQAPAAALPHLAQIQQAFGHHDVSAVEAHVGGAAASAARAMGAQAYATGQHVVFAEAPDLHMAAHEAAHVVQQRAGVQLSGGVGQRGDAYERHADTVADRVVQGGSAQGLLDAMGAAVASQQGVQCALETIQLGGGQGHSVLPGGGSFKDHYIRHKGLLEAVTGRTYPKWSDSNNGAQFIADLQGLVQAGTLDYKGLGTLKKGQPEARIYRGSGLTLVCYQSGAFWTLITTGQGLDLGIVMTAPT